MLATSQLPIHEKTLITALSLTTFIVAAAQTPASHTFVPSKKTDNTLFFSTSDKGTNMPILWGSTPHGQVKKTSGVVCGLSELRTSGSHGYHSNHVISWVQKQLSPKGSKTTCGSVYAWSATSEPLDKSSSR